MSQKVENANNVVQIAGNNSGNIYINTGTADRLTQEQYNALSKLVEAVEAAREVAGNPLSDKQIWSYLYRSMKVKSYDELTASQYDNATRYLLVSLQNCLKK